MARDCLVPVPDFVVIMALNCCEGSRFLLLSAHMEKRLTLKPMGHNLPDSTVFSKYLLHEILINLPQMFDKDKQVSGNQTSLQGTVARES
jgi:hypothetical protein